ncbi:MAG: protoporphyrinogen oxidase, partial [Deltaproteobacteria bacterium]|nr:protoporphyrinogen oxidase [Deltaproteobacteria bacterium]
MTVSMPNAPELDVAVVGGGLSGLVTAYRLTKRAEPGCNVSLRLFEANDRLGGQVQTEQRGDWLFETGPDSMVTAKAAASDLCRELGLGDELIAPRSAATFSLVHDRRLHPLPAGFRLIAPTEPAPLLRSRLLSWPGKLRMLLEPWVPRRAALEDGLAEDESVEDFVVRRFGRQAYERIAEPVLGGLFVADATRLSARRALGPFVELERREGSVLRGLRAASAPSKAPSAEAAHRSGPPAPSQLALERGLGSLITRLIEEIPASWLQLGCGVKAIRPVPEQPLWHVETTSGGWRAREVVLACPAPRCRDLLQAALPAVARALEEICFGSCVTVNAVYRRSDLKRLPSDFGFFVPRSEPYHILAANFSSEKFTARAPEEHVVVRTFQGGALDPDALDLDDKALTQRSHEDIADLIGATAPPLSSLVRRLRQSMPQFELGHFDRVEDLRRQIEAHRGLHIVGSGLGVYGLPDCVASGEKAAAGIELQPRRAGAT